MVETDSSCEGVWKCRVGNQEGDLVEGRLAVEKELGVGSRESRIVGRVVDGRWPIDPGPDKDGGMGWIKICGW